MGYTNQSIKALDRTNGFFDKSAMTDYGEGLFSHVTNSSFSNPARILSSQQGVNVQGVIFTTSSNNFYYGWYKSSISRYPRFEKYFAIFYKYPSTGSPSNDSITITFPSAFWDTTATKRDLSITRTIIPDYLIPMNEGDSLAGKLIPILAYESKDSYKFTGSEPTIEGPMGWIYSYMEGSVYGSHDGSTTVVENLEPSDIIDVKVGQRVKSTFKVKDASDGTRIPLFILDMNNGAVVSDSIQQSASDFNKPFAEGCIIPDGVAVDDKIFAGAQDSTQYQNENVDSTNWLNYFYVQNNRASTIDGTWYRGNYKIRVIDGNWGNSSDFAQAAGIAFNMDATAVSDSYRTMYSEGSKGVTQLFPSLSVNILQIKFMVDTSLFREGTVYVSDLYGECSCGWPSRADVPTRTGYNFVGWFDAASGGNRRYSTTTVARTHAVDGVITLYAQWELADYTLSLKSNSTPASTGNENYAVVSASTLPADKNVLYNTVLSSTYLPTPTSTSHDFVQWNTSSLGTGSTYTTSSTMPANNLTLHAIWALKTFIVTYTNTSSAIVTRSFKYGNSITIDKSGGTGGTDSFIITSDVTLVPPSKTGYTFGGWTYGANTFTATWVKINYTITYDYNNDSGNTSTQSYNIESSITIRNSPTYAGHTFDNWKVSSTEGNWEKDSLFSASEVVSAGKYGNPTLVAQWSSNSYVATFLTDGGIWSADNTSTTKTIQFTVDDTVYVPSAISKTGYTFSGWKITARSGNWVADTIYNINSPSIPFTGTPGQYGNVTFTAQWVPRTYSIIFDGNGSTGGSVQPQTKTYGKSITLRTNGFTKTGYDKDIDKTWNTKSDGSGSVYAPGSELTEELILNPNADGSSYITLYAQWEIFDYIAKFRPKGYWEGSTSQEDRDVTYNINTSVKAPGVVYRPGYSFKGWKVAFITTNSSWELDKVYNINDTVTPFEQPGKVGSLRFEAQWEIQNYNINYVNGGNIPTPQQFTIEDLPITLPTTPVKAGLEFIKWTTDPQGQNSITELTISNPDNMPRDVTVYGQWRVSLDKFTPYPGKPGRDQQYYGIPLEDLDQSYSYKIELTVQGDRGASYNNNYGTNSGVWKYIGDKKTYAQFQSQASNEVIFPYDVWRAIINHSTGSLSVKLVAYSGDSIVYETQSEGNTFVVYDWMVPYLKTVNLSEGVNSIFGLDLGCTKDITKENWWEKQTTTRFIGNAKSTVMAQFDISSYNDVEGEVLYEAVPAGYKCKLFWNPAENPGIDIPEGADWSELREWHFTQEDINSFIEQAKQNPSVENIYNTSRVIVSEIPFPKIRQDLEKCSLWVYVYDTRHMNG